MNGIRLLRADEIDCRIQTINKSGCSILLYKDARCDMNILDETFGMFNWKRSHSRDNANCTVSIWDDNKKEWVSKEDTGTESMTEKEKGLASDSFKRACFNWGIGRELYTAPFIWVKFQEGEVTEKNGKYYSNVKFHVSEIVYEGRTITSLTIKDNAGNIRYRFGNRDEVKEALNYIMENDKAMQYYMKKYVHTDVTEFTNNELKEIFKELVNNRKL